MLSFLYSLTLTSIYDYWKNHSFDIRTLISSTKSILPYHIIMKEILYQVPAWDSKCSRRARASGFKSHLCGFMAVWHWAGAEELFKVQLSHPWMTIGKTIVLYIQAFVGKVMSQLSNLLSRLVITFLPRSKRLLISWLQSPSTVENKVSCCFHCFPIYFPWSDGTRCHDLSFLNVEL